MGSVTNPSLKPARPSVRCVWDANEKAYRSRYYGFPFESSLAYIEEHGDVSLIRAWIEVFDAALDSRLYEYSLPIPTGVAGEGKEVERRLLLALRRDWIGH